MSKLLRRADGKAAADADTGCGCGYMRWVKLVWLAGRLFGLLSLLVYACTYHTVCAEAGSLAGLTLAIEPAG